MRKSFRILITDKCNMKCKTCFNKDLRTNKEMSVSDFIDLCTFLKSEGNISRVKIMGGEPTIHPKIHTFIEIAQEKFNSVHIFTNAVNDIITSLRMRKLDTIIYNLSCMGIYFPEKKLLPDEDFTHAFETRIDSFSDIDIIKRKLRHIHNILAEKMIINLTLNCTENIFLLKSKIINKWNNIVSFINEELNIEYNIDHGIPYCFFVGSNMKIQNRNSLCNLNCAGLITPDLFLRHCNQTSEKLLKIKQNGRFVPYKIIEQYMECEHNKMLYECLKKICKDCIFYGSKCNGGCFVFKPFIKGLDILNSTNLPTK